MKFALWFGLTFLVCFCCLAGNVSNGDVIFDGDFELPASAGHWTIFGTPLQDAAAPGINSALEGAETLQLKGDDPESLNFGGVYQDVVVGTTLDVGYVVSLNGIAGHIDANPIQGTNSAYLEIAFLDSMGVEFGLTASSPITSSTQGDTYFALSTGQVVVPVTATAVRFKAVFRQTGDMSAGDQSGLAWFDNLFTVESVPEPTSSFFLAGLGVVAAFRRRR